MIATAGWSFVGQRLRAVLLLSALLAACDTLSQAGREYVLELAEETPASRDLRHELVARRRAGPIVMVHRGASALAPENTLEAYSRAIDYGGDGVEVDVRRTADGVLVLFHDDMLDRLTHGIGEVRQLSSRALLALRPRFAFGRALGGTPPSFVQLLDLARQRAMLLHLDVKEPGLGPELARWLDAADCWDHVVAINTQNAPDLLAHPRYRPLRYKGPGLYEARRDLDPASVETALARDGEMIMVDDPRLAARMLGREPYLPVTLSQTFLYTRRPTAAEDASGREFSPPAHLAALSLRVNPASEPQLLELLNAPLEDPLFASSDDAALLTYTSRIVERAWAADGLGRLGRKTARVVRALEAVVRRPTPHPDWRFHGLDAALAARALGALGADGSASTIIAVLRRTEPTGSAAMRPESGSYPASWADARLKLHLVPALGDLRCRQARRYLREYVRLDEETARSFGPLQFEDATRALMRQNLSWSGIAELLRSYNPAVRGTALLECLDWPNEERRLALAKAASWALGLARAQSVPLAPRAPARPVHPGVAAPPKHAP